MVDFNKIEDLDQLESWLETQDPGINRAIAARASLRSLPSAMAVLDQNIARLNAPDLVLASFRATLITGVARTCPTPVMEKVNTSARSAHSAARTALASARSAALCALSSARSARSARSAALSAVYADANAAQNGIEVELFASPLWGGTEHIGHLLGDWEDFAARPDPDKIWAFWRDWYRGMLNGKPLDWDLQFQVALIKDAVWQDGAAAVAREIERIKENLGSETASTQDRFPEYEPKSINHLVENRIVITASLKGLAVQITDAVEQYPSEANANELPDAFKPLAELPSMFGAIATVLQSIPSSGEVTAETEQKLREENGRLNAKIAELQENVAALKSEISDLDEREKGKHWCFIKRVALMGSLVGIAPALAGGAWVLSADELGLKQRYENLAIDWQFVQDLIAGELSPASGLPQTQVDKSLRPVARPDSA